MTIFLYHFRDDKSSGSLEINKYSNYVDLSPMKSSLEFCVLDDNDKQKFVYDVYESFKILVKKGLNDVYFTQRRIKLTEVINVDGTKLDSIIRSPKDKENDKVGKKDDVKLDLMPLSLKDEKIAKKDKGKRKELPPTLPILIGLQIIMPKNWERNLILYEALGNVLFTF